MPSAWRLVVAVVALISGGTATTTASTATLTYGAAITARVDAQWIEASAGGASQVTDVPLGSAAPHGDDRGASTTFFHSFLATNTAEGSLRPAVIGEGMNAR